MAPVKECDPKNGSARGSSSVLAIRSVRWAVALVLLLGPAATGSSGVADNLAVAATTAAAGNPTIGNSSAASDDPAAVPQDVDWLPPNPFAGFETHILPNGFKVWFKYLPEDPKISVGIAVGAGRDQDPPGKEQLAHLLEHTLFGSQPDRTEEEMKREILDLGGTYNGLTFDDHTFYYVNIDKLHGLLALDWLYRIISPHEITPVAVDRQRDPVAVEIKARKRDLIDWIDAVYVDPPWLRLFDFWRREFGLETRTSRDYYSYRSLYSLTAQDLHWFYDTYYVANQMTLTVAGDFDRDSMLAQVRETFGTLASDLQPPGYPDLHDPGRPRRFFEWEPRSNTSFRCYYKLFDMTPDQQMMMIFLRYWLKRRLMHELRFGERKAVYGIQVALRQRGPAGYFCIYGDIKPGDLQFARDVIAAELDLLRSGDIPAEEFETERAAIARSARIGNARTDKLTSWPRTYFYAPGFHQDFPDIVAYIEQVGPDQVAVFVRDHFTQEHHVLGITYPLPLSLGVLALICLVLVWVAVRVARGFLIRPIDMTAIRYVARFQLRSPYRFLLAFLFVFLLAVAGRLLAQGYLFLWARCIGYVDSFWIQGSCHAAAVFLGLLLLILALAAIPHKILVFRDHLRIKYLCYRSTMILPEEITELAQRRFASVWLSARIWRCTLLTTGIFAPGLYMRLRSGKALFFRVRSNAELLRVLHDMKADGGVGEPTA